VGTIVTHKPCKFQEYWLRELRLWGQKVAEISNFLDFPTGNPQKFGMAQRTQFSTVVPTSGKNHFNTSSSLPVNTYPEAKQCVTAVTCISIQFLSVLQSYLNLYACNSKLVYNFNNFNLACPKQTSKTNTYKYKTIFN